MTPEPLVTIFTPCYNHEPYLDDYFRGLLSQTYRNIQLILVDDGSTDGSWNKVCAYAERLKRAFPLVTLERRANVGADHELIAFFPLVQGALFSLLESDDAYLPARVETVVRYLQQHPEMGAVHTETDFIDRHGRRLEHRHWRTIGRRVASGWILEPLLLDNFIMNCSFCCRTQLFREHIMGARYAEFERRGYMSRDYAIFLELARHAPIGYIDDVLARYRVLPESYSHTLDPRRRFRIELDYHQIKLDFMDEFGGPERARDLAVEGLHQARFLYGFRLQSREQCEQAYAWLMRRNPERFGRLPFRTLALSLRHPLLWRLMRRIEDVSAVQRAALAWFSLRNRGQS